MTTILRTNIELHQNAENVHLQTQESGQRRRGQVTLKSMLTFELERKIRGENG